MPKIIQNVREQLLIETKKQIVERGYAKTTVRSVADACGIGVGTVYNYFASKDMLIATFVAEDWQAELNSISLLPADDPEKLLGGIYESLCRFAENNKALFSDEDAAKVISIGFSERHKMLRDQIAEFIKPLCREYSFEDRAFASRFISEALICWSMDNQEFEKVFGILKNLFIK